MGPPDNANVRCRIDLLERASTVFEPSNCECKPRGVAIVGRLRIVQQSGTCTLDRPATGGALPCSVQTGRMPGMLVLVAQIRIALKLRR